MISTYLAARFGRRAELEGYVPLFNKCGFDVTARWVYGGEAGLTRTDIAVMDLNDVLAADCFILFTEEYKSLQPGGGRFVEFGYALALDKQVIVIGDYENVFTHHPDVKVFKDLDTFVLHYEKMTE